MMKQNKLVLKSIKKLTKIPLILLILCIFCLTIPAFAQDDSQNAQPDQTVNYVSGKILKIVSEKDNKILEDSFHSQQIVQTVKVLVLSGKYKGETVTIDNQLTSNPIYDINLKSGDRVILSVEEGTGSLEFFISDVERVPVLLILTGVFLASLMIIGGIQGLRSIISIVVTAGLVFFVLVPAVFHCCNSGVSIFCACACRT